MTIKNKAGVYRITNTENGKRYYGSSKNLRRRWREHKSDLRLGKHGNPGIKEDAANCGVEAFEFTVLCYCKPEDRKRLEGAVIDQSLGKDCYNRSNGNGTHSDETIAKISAAHTGKTLSEEHKANISAAHTGKTLSEEHKAKLRKPKPKATCPHCGKVGGVGPMHRYHFDRCKDKP